MEVSIMEPIYLSIQPVETEKRIKQLLSEQHYTVHEIQGAFGFENPQAIYKWLSGKSLPSLDNFVILSKILNTSIENILVIDRDIPHLYTFSVVQHQSSIPQVPEIFCHQSHSFFQAFFSILVQFSFSRQPFIRNFSVFRYIPQHIDTTTMFFSFLCFLLFRL